MHDDAQFLSDYDRWPCYPLCPVKRYNKNGSWPELGVILAGTTNVYKVKMYELAEIDITAADKYEYSTVEQMVADGWMVD